MADLHVPRHEECGFRGTPSTAGRAALALRQHSCDRQRRLAAARDRAGEALVDRTPKPCRHKNARHQHGTDACYKLDGCNCLPCTRAHSAYETRRVRLIAYGRWQPYVDAGPAAAHVRHLMAAGIGLRQITALSGVPRGALWKLIYGKRGADGVQRPSTRIRPETESRLLAVQDSAESLAGGVRVDATGTHRRLQALMTLGWPEFRLAKYIGMTASNFAQLMDRGRVTKATADRVANVYDQLWDTPPPQIIAADKAAARRAREHAQQQGWAPPMAWDEELNPIDDPATEPDLGGPVRRAKLPPAEELQYLLDAGESEDMIASRFGVKATAVKRALQRDGADAAAQAGPAEPACADEGEAA